jgi:hypothetical protein
MQAPHGPHRNTSHVTAISPVSWRVTTAYQRAITFVLLFRARIAGCLSSRCLETDCTTPFFTVACVYYLATDVSVAQPFLHGTNTPQY